MVVCKFFLQGNCKYGNSCRYEHDQGQNHSNYGHQDFTSPIKANAGNKSAHVPSTNVDTNALVMSVVNDMTSAEKGGQWLVSSYAPFKEKPEFPGFVDYSFEEGRQMYYEAARNGTTDQFVQQWQNVLQQALMRVRALQNPSPEAVATLKNIYYTSPTGNNVNNLNQNSSSNYIIGNTHIVPSSSSDSFYGSQPSETNLLNICFNTTQKNSHCSEAQNQASPLNIFKSKPQNYTVLTNKENGGCLFNNAQQNFQNNQQTPSLACQNGNTIFTNQSNASSRSNLNHLIPNLFTQQSLNQHSLQFSSSLCNSQNKNTSFGDSQHTGYSNQKFSDDKGGLSTNLPAQFIENSITGNFIQNRGHPSSRLIEDAYSRLADLSELDIKWFQNDDINLEDIPCRPPTYELCN